MTTLSRRHFARLLALSGSAALFPGRAFAGTPGSPEDMERALEPLPRTPAEPDEAFWREVRARFLVPRDVGFFNPGLRVAPHFYNTIEDVDRFVRAVGGYLRKGSVD